MALKKSEKNLLIIMLVAIVLFAVMKLTGKKPKVASLPKQAISKVVDKVVESASFEKKEKPLIKQQPEKWGKDPFRTEVKVVRVVKKKPPAMVCKGMFTKGGRIFVMINDMIMSEGDEKQGILVEKIEGNQIYCRWNDELIILNWKGST